ncbi:MAG TPA: alpha/beta fold hydrolase [Steroidobacteraceae bacterium]|nr:alpha/beta fold hydrolase [Steroidobacteraceae bacterium]
MDISVNPFAATVSAIGILALGIGAAASASTFIPHHRVHIEGDGPRTVILESGFGDTLDIWQPIQPQIAANCARTFSYNRAGYLDSDPSADARDAASIVGELREELQRRNLNPPYVLVGHSLGGLYMQYFARNFPGEVAGLVLIDSTHWQQGLRVDSTANTPYDSRKAIMLYMPLVMRRELSDSTEAGLEVNGSPGAWAIPTIVLSSTRVGPIETADQRALAVKLQNSIAADFPGARHVFVENSGHYIQRDKPAVVIDAIRAIAGCDPR